MSQRWRHISFWCCRYIWTYMDKWIWIVANGRYAHGRASWYPQSSGSSGSLPPSYQEIKLLIDPYLFLHLSPYAGLRGSSWSKWKVLPCDSAEGLWVFFISLLVLLLW